MVKRLAEALGSDVYTLKLALNRPRPLVLADRIEAAAADQAAEMLRQLGHEVYVFGRDEFGALAEPVRPRTLELHRDHVRFIVPPGEILLSQWSNLFLLVRATCRIQAQRIAEEHVYRAAGPEGFHMQERRTESRREGLNDLLDIYFYDGSRPVRIDADRFSFAFLGSKVGLADSQSLETTLRAFRKLAPQAAIDRGFEQFKRGAGALGRTGKARGTMALFVETRVDDDGPRFDFYSRLMFMICLRRAEQPPA
jgi:hypothetical protein